MSIGWDSTEVTDKPTTSEITHSLVQDKFDLMTGYAGEAFNAALNSMDQVGDIGIDFDWEPPPPLPGGDSGISGLNPVVPQEPDINLVSVTVAQFNEDVPTLQPLTYTDLTPPTLNFNWESDDYDDDLQRPLKQKIIDGILNGGTGILPEVEQAIYDREKNRLDIDAEQKELLARSEFSSTGARIPQGALIARIDNVRLDRGLKLADVNRDVMVQSSDLAQKYSMFVIEKGIALESELINLFGGIQTRDLDASKFTVQNLVEEFRVRVEGSTARLNADVEMNKLTMSVFDSRIKLFVAQLSANETYAKVQAEVEGLKLQVFDGNVKKFTAIVQAISDVYKADVSRDVANSEIILRHGDMLARIATAQAEINAELIKARGTVGAQLASAALGSVSAGASLGYSQSRGDTTQRSAHEQKSESVTMSFLTNNCCNK